MTLISILLHSELAPMRRASDNRVALLSQLLVFLWVFALLLRIAGMFQTPVWVGTCVGVMLCVATVGVLVTALVLANIDRLSEQRAERRASTLSEATPEVQTTESSNSEDDSSGKEAPERSNAEELEAGSRLQDEYEEKKAEESANGLPWPLLLIGNTSLCGAETTEEEKG